MDVKGQKAVPVLILPAADPGRIMPHSRCFHPSSDDSDSCARRWLGGLKDRSV